jgi:hypothetical protein
MVPLLRRNIIAAATAVFHFGQELSKLGIPSTEQMRQNSQP